MTNLSLTNEETIRAASIDSGVKVAYMDWNDGDLILVLAKGKEVKLRPNVADLYMEVRRALT